MNNPIVSLVIGIMGLAGLVAGYMFLADLVGPILGVDTHKWLCLGPFVFVWVLVFIVGVFGRQ